MALGLLILLVLVDLAGITADLRASIALVLGLGLLGTGVAYILYYFIVAELGAVTASGATYIPPVVALAIGWLAVGEPLSWYDGAAVALILAGVVILRLGGRPPTDRHRAVDPALIADPQRCASHRRLIAGRPDPGAAVSPAPVAPLERCLSHRRAARG